MPAIRAWPTVAEAHGPAQQVNFYHPFLEMTMKPNQTDEVREFILKTYAGGVVPAF